MGEVNEKKAGDTNKSDDGPITVVLKLDLHCDGCAKKVKKSVRYIEGVKIVQVDSANNKLTITGKVDPVRIKERVECKTKKKVEIISPKPKKDDAGGEKKAGDKPTEPKSGDQKPKERQSTAAVLKISLHCDGCIQKIRRIISKIDGVESVIPDANKNLVTVKGTMNMNELIPYLKDKLKRNVDVVPPKKEEDKGGEKKDEKKVEGGGDKKDEKKAEGGGDKKDEKEVEGGGDKKDEKKVEGGGDKKEKEGGKDGDDKKKIDVEKTIDSSETKKADKAEATNGGDEKSDGEVKPSGSGGDGTKNVDLVNKSEYYGYHPYIYTMPVYNQNYHNQDYGVSVFSNHGSANEGYVNHGYAMEYQHVPLAPPSPIYLQDPRVSENDMFSAENPNACSLM